MTFNDLVQLCESESVETITYYDTEKQIPHRIRWRNKDGNLHRIDGPASINYHPNGRVSSETWYYDEKMHRVGGPASQSWSPEGKKLWEIWKKMGVLHRIGGPAKTWWVDHKPYVIEEYYINGTQYTKEQYEKLFAGVDKDLHDDLDDMLQGFE